MMISSLGEWDHFESQKAAGGHVPVCCSSSEIQYLRIIHCLTRLCVCSLKLHTFKLHPAKKKHVLDKIIHYILKH